MFPLLTKSEKWIKDITRYKAACDSLDEGKLKDKLIGYVNTFKSLSDEIDVGHQSGSGGYIKPRQLIDIKHNLLITKDKIESILKQLK
ncbi:hypothetical protein N9C48_00025 [bacterium]|jgi:hypothetical protein|nr:hypothetical protein [bacterium]MDA9938475.1 hypothetical protein [bacterium]